MEGILVLVVMIGMWWAFSFVVSAGARTVRATGRSVMGKGSLAENMELEFKGIPAFQTRIQAGRVGDDGDGPLAVEIEARGLFPVDRTTQVGFITSIFDATDG